MSDTTIEPTGPLTIGTIPDADLDRLIAATVPANTITTDDDDWMSRTSDGKLVRGVEFARYDTSTAGVAVDGWQHQDGAVERHVGLYDVPAELTSVQARELAAALAGAADELDRLNGEVPPFM